MINIIVSEGVSSDYMPQIIGIIGAILGAVVGWLLQSLSTNRTKIKFDIDYFYDRRAVKEYAYIMKLFVYNNSYKPQCMRNVRLSFKKCMNKEVLKSSPRLGKCTFDEVKGKYDSEKEIDILPINSYTQCQFMLSGVISDDVYDKLFEVKKIYVVYKNSRNRTKKILVKKNFSLGDVEEHEDAGFI